MNRVKRHKVKMEKPETSTSYREPAQDYDLTYYIHDRVELMHQVFSVLKHKELRAITPECVRHISIDDLQELCTEELLGISSKRLCAILDGAEAPSDTESSSESEEKLETISLDSISSDEEILSETSSKKKKHKRHHRDKSKAKRVRKGRESPRSGEGGAEQSRAARAGLTVLELLELQARARAIRAQLHQDQAAKQTVSEPAQENTHSSDNEVEIKEEPAEVVEISSEDEKPDLKRLNETSAPKDKPVDTPSATKRISDLVITVPKAKQGRKIKLNRTKLTVSISNADRPPSDANTSSEAVSDDVTVNNGKADKTTVENKINDDKADKNKTNDREVSSKGNSVKTAAKTNEKVISKNNANDKEAAKAKEKQKRRVKKKNKKKTEEKDSDDDGITLQLSDTEKMDLLEDLDRKNFEIVSSSGSEDSESSSSDSSDDETVKDEIEDNKDSIIIEDGSKTDIEKAKDLDKTENSEKVLDEEINVNGSDTKENASDETFTADVSVKEPSPKQSNGKSNKETCQAKVTNKETSDGNDKKTDDDDGANDVTESQNVNDSETKEGNTDIKEGEGTKSPEKNIEIDSIDDIPVQVDTVPAETSAVTDAIIEEGQKQQNEEAQKEMSDGEISDRASSEIEAVVLKPEVVCISDTEEQVTGKKKKKKKEKKSKSKKSKKSKSDFRESSDQNFYKENEPIILIEDNDKKENNETSMQTDHNDDINKHDETNRDDIVINDKVLVKQIIISEGNTQNLPEEVVVKSEDATSDRTVNLDEDYDDVYEILELSDDSSCYEVEGTVLSKEPTAEEIEALSARIDEIEREDVITEEEIRQHESLLAKTDGNVENISWKDRYLESNKVKRVLSTANIFNALRKKNIELKKKLEESKKEEDNIEEKEPEVVKALEEGSIEHFNTLQGSTKFVDPVKEASNTDSDAKVSDDIEKGDKEQAVSNSEPSETPQVVKEMRKDAKQLLKMYKMLLKYNDVNKKKDPSKKKKKKSKKKNKESVATNSTA